MKRTDPHNIFRWLTPAVRTWLYGILIAAIPLLTIYGIIDQEQAPLWVAMAGAILGMGTAVAHVPTRATRDEPSDHATSENPATVGEVEDSPE